MLDCETTARVLLMLAAVVIAAGVLARAGRRKG